MWIDGLMVKLTDISIRPRYNGKVESLLHRLYECGKTSDMWNAIVMFLN